MNQSGISIVGKEPLANTALKWSPHAPDILALGSSQHFGVVGNGMTQIKKIEGNNLVTLAALEENDAIFDISWFELRDNFVLIGSGSGQAVCWQIGKGKAWVSPLKSQIHSIQCSFKNPLFIAGCLNGVVHFGNCEDGKVLFQLPAHIKNCNEVKWHPSSEKVFASAGGDGMLKMWDHTLPKPNISSHQAHQAEILSIDFNKYEEQIVTSSLDKSVRVWDLRNLSHPINVLQHHRYPAKKVRFSPHAPWLLASGGFDMNIHFYDLRDANQPLKMKGAQHKQFISGIQFNLYAEKTVCTTSWDQTIMIWQWDKPQPVFNL